MTFQSTLALQKRQLNSTIRDASTHILEQIDGKLPQATSQNSLCKNKKMCSSLYHISTKDIKMIRNNIYESAWTQKAQGNGREVAMATNICKRFKSPQKTSKTTFNNRRLDTSILGSPFRYISKKNIHIIRKRTALT